MNDESDEQDDKALFQQAMQVFNPFAYPGDNSEPEQTKTPDEPEQPSNEAADVIDALRNQMSAMQEQLNSLAKKKD